MTDAPAAQQSMDDLHDAWRRVTEPMRAPLEDHDVTDAEAALAQQHLAAVDDDLFDRLVFRMASVQQARFLRRLLTETEEEAEAPEAVRAFVARLAEKGSVGTIRAAVSGLRRHALGRLLEPLARISVRQVMLAALILIFVGFVGARVNPVLGRWVLIAGVILFLTSFALSFLHRGPGAPATDRRWRGRPLDLREPGPGDRLRAWFRKRGQRRY